MGPTIHGDHYQPTHRSFLATLPNRASKAGPRRSRQYTTARSRGMTRQFLLLRALRRAGHQYADEVFHLDNGSAIG